MVNSSKFNCNCYRGVPVTVATSNRRLNWLQNNIPLSLSANILMVRSEWRQTVLVSFKPWPWSFHNHNQVVFVSKPNLNSRGKSSENNPMNHFYNHHMYLGGTNGMYCVFCAPERKIWLIHFNKLEVDTTCSLARFALNGVSYRIIIVNTTLSYSLIDLYRWLHSFKFRRWRTDTVKSEHWGIMYAGFYLKNEKYWQ